MFQRTESPRPEDEARGRLQAVMYGLLNRRETLVEVLLFHPWLARDTA
jgi:hypothetical protein